MFLLGSSDWIWDWKVEQNIVSALVDYDHLAIATHPADLTSSSSGKSCIVYSSFFPLVRLESPLQSVFLVEVLSVVINALQLKI